MTTMVTMLGVVTSAIWKQNLNLIHATKVPTKFGINYWPISSGNVVSNILAYERTDGHTDGWKLLKLHFSKYEA